VTLSNEVECDEAYVIAGHKGQPEVVQSKGRQGRRCRLKGKAGRGTLEKERPPVFGMMQRGGQVVINLLANAHSIGFSGGQLASYVAGSSARDFPLIQDARSQDRP